MKFLSIISFACVIFLGGNNVSAQPTDISQFPLFGDLGVVLEYSKNFKPIIITTEGVGAVWKAKVTSIKIVNKKEGVNVFPLPGNTAYLFDEPVDLYAEATISALKLILEGATNSVAATSTLTGTVTTEGVKKFIRACYNDQNSKVLKGVLWGLDGAEVLFPGSKYTIKITMQVKPDGIVVSEDVFNKDNMNVFNNSNEIKVDMKPYIKKLLDQLNPFVNKNKQ